MKKGIAVVMLLVIMSMIVYHVWRGKAVRVGDTVFISYFLTKGDGTRLDDSFCYSSCSNIENSLLRTKVGMGWLVPDWDNGLIGMREAETKKILITPKGGWGHRPPPGVSSADTLILLVTLHEIK